MNATSGSWRRRRRWWVSALSCWIGAPFLCSGCLFAPSAAELQEAGTRVSTQAIEQSAQAVQDELTRLRAEERLRQTTDAYEAAMRSASDSLANLSRSANDLVLVLRETPTSLGAAMTSQESVQVAMKNVSEMTVSVERGVGAVQDTLGVLRMAVADLRGDLTRNDGVLTLQRTALLAELRREREVVLAALQQERAVVLDQADEIAQRLVDLASRRMAELTDLTGPRLIDHVATARASSRA